MIQYYLKGAGTKPAVAIGAHINAKNTDEGGKKGSASQQPAAASSPGRHPRGCKERLSGSAYYVPSPSDNSGNYFGTSSSDEKKPAAKPTEKYRKRKLENEEKVQERTTKQKKVDTITPESELFKMIKEIKQSNDFLVGKVNSLQRDIDTVKQKSTKSNTTIYESSSSEEESISKESQQTPHTASVQALFNLKQQEEVIEEEGGNDLTAIQIECEASNKTNSTSNSITETAGCEEPKELDSTNNSKPSATNEEEEETQHEDEKLAGLTDDELKNALQDALAANDKKLARKIFDMQLDRSENHSNH